MFLAGETYVEEPGDPSTRTPAPFVRLYDPGGTELWTRLLGALPGNGHDVAVDASGVFVVGETTVALPGEAFAGESDAFVLSMDQN